MKQDIINTVLFGAAFLVLFASAELLYHIFKIRAEFTRKYVHISSGIITLLFPLYIHNHWFVLILCSSFALILFTSLQYNLLKSINAVDRKTWGSLAFPAAVYFCFLASVWSGKLLFFYLPILIMAVSDPLAALIGKKWPIGVYKISNENKSLAGSTAFLTSAFIISFVIFYNLTDLSVNTIFILSFLSATATAITEAISRKGLDNITIPAAAILILCIFYYVL